MASASKIMVTVPDPWRVGAGAGSVSVGECGRMRPPETIDAKLSPVHGAA